MSFIQSAQGHVTSGTTVSATFGTATAGGASIICLISAQSGTTVSSIALTGGADTFTKAANVLESTFGEDAEIWIDASDSSGHTTVTVTFGASVSPGAELTIIEWSNISSGTPDKTHTGSSASGVTSWSSGATAALTQPLEVAFGVVTANSEGAGAITFTGPGAPWTNLAAVNAAAGVSQLAGYQQVNATTALTYNGTSNVSVAYACAIATFKLNAPPAPAAFTPPGQAPRGRAGVRGRQLGPGLASVGAPIRPTPATFIPPRSAPRGRAGVRGRGIAASSGAPVIPTPAPFTPPRSAPRGRRGVQGRQLGPGLAAFPKVTPPPPVLLISLASKAGVDDYGTAFPQGILATEGLIEGPVIVAGAPNGVQLQLTGASAVGALNFLLNNLLYGGATLSADVQATFAQVFLNGPKLLSEPDFVGVELNSNTGSGTASMVFIYTDANGTTHSVANFSDAGFTIPAGAIGAVEPGTGTSPTNAAFPEIWHAATLPGGWGGGISYKLYPDNTVGLAGTVTLPSAGSYNNVTLFNLPSAYIPPGTKNMPIAAFATSSAYGNNGSSGGLPRVVVASGSGAVSFAGIPASVNSSQVCLDGVRFPLDF